MGVSFMTIRAVIFDIGGVVVGSPVAAIGEAEKRWSLPPHWINASITAMGDDGPFQRFERSEISQDEFYREFGARLSDVESGNDAMRGMFDEYVESCVEGLRKPDPAFFRVALDRVGVEPHEAVFLDDIGHNLAAARKLGMHTIRVKHGKSREAIDELEKLLGMDLSSPLAKL